VTIALRARPGIIVLAAIAVTSQVSLETRARRELAAFREPIAIRTCPLGVKVALEQYDDAALQRNLAAISAMGFFLGAPDFSVGQDRAGRGPVRLGRVGCIVQATGDLRVIAVLDTSPLGASPVAGRRNPVSTFCARRFARFAAEFARRYGKPD